MLTLALSLSLSDHNDASYLANHIDEATATATTTRMTTTKAMAVDESMEPTK